MNWHETILRPKFTNISIIIKLFQNVLLYFSILEFARLRRKCSESDSESEGEIVSENSESESKWGMAHHLGV